LIGSPASGKSFLSNQIIKNYENFVRINNDTDKNGIASKFASAYKNGKNIIIDNTNMKENNRNKFIDPLKDDKS